MREQAEDYRDYTNHLSNLAKGLIFILGFMFTVITILLTQLPNPGTLQNQVTLIFLSIIFHVTAFFAFLFTLEPIYYCKKLPPSQND